MPVLPLVIAPDERLNKPSERVATITPELKTLAQDMLETMYANNGIGLAAVQVGVHKRLIVVDVSWSAHQPEGSDELNISQGEPLILLNPEITSTSEEMNLYNEGCLSFPEQFSQVQRPKSATVTYMDLEGNNQTLKVDEILATCIQHEIDHINGVVFVDHISKLKRDMILKKLKKQKKLGQFDELPEHSELKV